MYCLVASLSNASEREMGSLKPNYLITPSTQYEVDEDIEHQWWSRHLVPVVTRAKRREALPGMLCNCLDVLQDPPDLLHKHPVEMHDTRVIRLLHCGLSSSCAQTQVIIVITLQEKDIRSSIFLCLSGLMFIYQNTFLGLKTEIYKLCTSVDWGT
jgi:hypothetical protein